MTEDLDRDIDRLFDEQLLPLSRRLKGEGVTFLETRLDKDAPSYFVRRTSTEMKKGDFEKGGCSTPQAVEADFADVWGGGDVRLLANLAPAMAGLARSLRHVEEESVDVSEFIYVMY